MINFVFTKQTIYESPEKMYLAGCLRLKKYLDAKQPSRWLFNGKDHREPFSPRGVQWVVREATKRTKIQKHVSVHTLRHTYATHLLEQGLDIVSIKELLGHAHIETTMVYLHACVPKRRHSGVQACGAGRKASTFFATG